MTYQDTILSRSPVYYLPLTELTGVAHSDVFADATGNAHTGEMTDYVTPGDYDSFLVGQKAPALTNGGGEVIPEPAAGFPTVSAWTVDFWLHLGASITDPQTWFDWSAMNTSFSSPFGVRLIQEGADTWHWEMFFSRSLSVELPFSMSDPYCWHYYALTYDGTTARLYRDGAPVASNSDSSIAGWSSTVAATQFESDSYPQPVHVAQHAFYSSALSDVQIAANFAAATPRQDDDCFRQTIRLSHNGGTLDWTHDKTTFKVYSDGAVVLETPLVELPGLPAQLVGRDPASTLPAYCPAPVITTAPPTPPAPAPDPTTAPNIRCGAAVQMATALEQAYANVVQYGRAIVSLAGPWVISAIIDFLVELFSAGEATGALVIDQAALQQLATFVLNNFLAVEWPALTSTADDAILQGIYCALTVVDGQVVVDGTTLDTWRSNMAAASGSFTGLQQPLLDLISRVPLLEHWRADAYQGAASPTDVCAGFTCP